MARRKTDDELHNEISSGLNDVQDMLDIGDIGAAQDCLGLVEESLVLLKQVGNKLDDRPLRDKADLLSKAIAAAQQRADDGGGDAPVEVNDGGGGAAEPVQARAHGGGAPVPAQQGAQYGVYQQNNTDNQDYVALAGDEDGGEKDGPCDKCVIL